MRIGILTLPLYTNYGGILQAYALQAVLTRMGHDVVVLGGAQRREIPWWWQCLRYAKRIAKNIMGEKCTVFEERRLARERVTTCKYTYQFINKYIRQLPLKNLRCLNENDVDAIVVGSDQIWRGYFSRWIKDAYLDFASSWEIKRYSYAASFGTEDWGYTPKQTRQCAALLHKFNAVSVRESSGVKLCREHFGIEALHVLDPTMLLTPEDYKQLIDCANVAKQEGELLCYVLDITKEKSALIEKVSRATGKQPFRTNSLVEDRNAPLSERIQPPVEQWLQGFINAEFVVTDSFHGTVFSILFNKPFVVVANEKRGNVRFASLLSMFGLEQCLYSEAWTTDNLFSIDWDRVNLRLADLRKLSYNFLSQIK